MKAAASYMPTEWDEKPYEQISPSVKMTRASAVFEFKGEMEGRGLVEYLMYYRHADESDPHNAEAVYVGLIRFTGRLHGKSGSFVLEDHGTFEGRAARSTLTIVPGSGTDELRGITGKGTYAATPKDCQSELVYDLA